MQLRETQYLVPLRRQNKILVLVLTAFLLTSLTVRSETAPNLLELDEGITVTGNFHQITDYSTMTFSVDKI